MIYGLRLSVLFGFSLTAVTSIVGIVAGAVQGYYGGLTDLLFQRFIEIWNGMPELYLLIILAQHHHAELLGAADIPAAVPLDEPDRTGARRIPARAQSRIRARGEGARRLRHHRDVAAHPAQRDGGDADLSAVHPVRLGDICCRRLDFLGFGLPPGSPSLGELVAQARSNLQAPWLGFTAFFVLGGVLTLLIFVGEAVRDAFDPRRLPV